jgi:protein-disulfide isomerase
LIAGAALIAIFPPHGVVGAEFTTQQRREIIEIVREALKSDPSILREAVEALQSNEADRQAVAARAAIQANRDALYGQSDPTGGTAEADVTIVEFLDPRCPYCRQVAPALAMLRRNDPGIRLIYKDMPVLGPASVLASRALLAAERQGGYETLLTAMTSGPPEITEESLRNQAQELGLDWPRMQKDMTDPQIQRRFDANRQLAKTLGIEGTPAFVIGDRIIAGSDIAEVQSAIAAVRAQRKAGGGAAARQ